MPFEARAVRAGARAAVSALPEDRELRGSAAPERESGDHADGDAAESSADARAKTPPVATHDCSSPVAMLPLERDL
jgi:hypothetical protein